jgi:hypothetical protein
VPADVSATVEAGQETAVQLQAVGGSVAPFVVVAPPPAAELAVASGAGSDPATLGVSSGPDGTMLVTPADGFLGTTTFTYAIEGSRDVTATATITVVGNRPPVAGDDTLAIDPAVATEVLASELLANDTDPDGDPLRIVSVTGATGGQAWLHPDRPVVVVVPGSTAAAGGVTSAAAGDVTFSYVVADADGAMATASVTATASGGPTPSPSAAPTPSPSATPVPTSTPRPTRSPAPTASAGPGSTNRPTVTTPPTLAGQPGTADPARESGPLLLLLGVGTVAGLGLLIAARRRRGRRIGAR